MAKYQVNINQVWSETLTVTANNAQEAKKLAWEKWNAKKKNYTIEAEKE